MKVLPCFVFIFGPIKLCFVYLLLYPFFFFLLKRKNETKFCEWKQKWKNEKKKKDATVKHSLYVFLSLHTFLSLFTVFIIFFSLPFVTPQGVKNLLKRGRKASSQCWNFLFSGKANLAQFSQQIFFPHFPHFSFFVIFILFIWF